ncbi:MAG: ATP-binding protein [Thermodesulfobacteriota bacterium]
MRKEAVKSPVLADKALWIGVGLGLLFWPIESAIHAYIFYEGTLIRQLFNPAAHEVWMRGVVVLMFITFGVYAQSIINRRKRTNETLREGEEKLASIVDSVTDQMIMVDDQFNIVWANNVARDLSGSDMTGKKCHVVYHGRDTKCEACIVRKVFEDGRVHEFETQIMGAEGKQHIFWGTASVAARYEDGRPRMVVEFLRDITERKKAEEELRKYQSQLESMVEERTAELMATNEELQQEITERIQAEEELLRIKINLEEANHQLKQNQAQLVQSEKMASIGQLAAGVAHEINNPVGFINSNLTTLDEYRRDLTTLISSFLELEQLAARNPALSPDQDLAGVLETIRNLKEKMDIDFVLGDFDKVIAESREGTERVKKIVQDLKNFSHVDQAELKWANLNKGLDSTLNIVWNELKYKAKVIKDYGDIPEVCCYPQQVNQVFMNILVNAAQAIEDTGEIKISTAHLDGAEPMVEVRISDTGKGIPPENLPKIFDPFFTTKPVGKGTGLGLSTAYNIVKKHQGEIKVESAVGKGTTFIVTLPVEGPKEA